MADNVDADTITVEYSVVAENVSEVENYHHQGYDERKIEFGKNHSLRLVEVEISEDKG